MTRRQIDSSRERRLWLGQVIIPTLTLIITAMSIPEVRETTKVKAKEIKRKIENRFKK